MTKLNRCFMLRVWNYCADYWWVISICIALVKINLMALSVPTVPRACYGASWLR